MSLFKPSQYGRYPYNTLGGQEAEEEWEMAINSHLGENQEDNLLKVIVNSSTLFSVKEQLICRNMRRFYGGLEFKAHRLLYHPTLG